MTYLDKTFCASTACVNKCGHKMTDEEKIVLKTFIEIDPNAIWPVSYTVLCDEQGEPIEPN